MEHLNSKKIKKNTIVTAKVATFAMLAATIMIVAGPATIIGINQQADAACCVGGLAPVAVSGDNIYVTWWTNNTENANGEVMFRVSTDGGATFGDKINLSNTTDADSVDAEIAAEGETVIVSWWERNQTSDIPVARVSNDAGATFGSLMMLGANGTLGSGEAEEIGVAEEGEGGG